MAANMDGVGELTIAIGILILASLIWSGFNKQKDANQKSVQIEKVDNGTFYGSISIIQQNSQNNELILDSRPSDAMVIALKLNIPILCDKSVLEKAGFKKSKLDIDNPIESDASSEDNVEKDNYSPLGEKERKSLSVFESFIDTLDIDE